MQQKDIQHLRRVVWKHYRAHGRHDLPWRLTENPYHILISEIMLQQTQVSRVISKYLDFIAHFPTLESLAVAPLSDVLVLWQGLGYNRRAKMLHALAGEVCARYGGQLPNTYEALLSLPGVGPYTAMAVCVFAYNAHAGMVETNVRTVLFHHIYANHIDVVCDKDLSMVAYTLCPRGRAREWYWALMDYGAYLKSTGVRLNAKSAHYVKQSKFEGSDRQIRGALLRVLAQERKLPLMILLESVDGGAERVHLQLCALQNEGLVTVSAFHECSLAS